MKGIPIDMQIIAYDTLKKRPIGIFKTPTMAARYFFHTKYLQACNSRIAYAAKTGGKSQTERFDFKVAFRYHHGEQISEDYFIYPEYPKPEKTKMDGFHSTRIELATEHKRSGFQKKRG